MPETSTFRVICYGRISIDRDQRSKSVDDQLSELHRWARREGWSIAADYRDDGVSASAFAIGSPRPGWQHVLDDIAAGSADALLVWEISRASRDRPVFAALFAAVADAGVRLGTGGRLHDLTDPDDGFALDLGAALSVRESAMISKRTLRAAQSRAAAGRPAGSVPYGYRRIIDQQTGLTTGRELHPDQAPVVAEIVRRLLAREAAGAIARDLNRRGVPTGTADRWLGRHIDAVIRHCPETDVAAEITRRKLGEEPAASIAADLNARHMPKPLPSQWRAGNLRTLALRPTYAGLRVHRGEVLDDVRGTWPPIITETQHHALVELFADPARRKFRQSTQVRHLGAGLFRCGRDGCTGRMRVVAARPAAYQCRQCYRVQRRVADVDGPVERLLVARLAQPDVLERLTDPADNPALNEAAAEAEALRGRLAHARELVDSGRLSLDDYVLFRDRWQPRLEDAERRARPRHLPPAVVDLAARPDTADRWAALDIHDRRTILDALLIVTIRPAERRRAGPELIDIQWRSDIS